MKLPTVLQELEAILEQQLNEATGTDWDSFKASVGSAALQVFDPATRNPHLLEKRKQTLMW